MAIWTGGWSARWAVATLRPALSGFVYLPTAGLPAKVGLVVVPVQDAPQAAEYRTLFAAATARLGGCCNNPPGES